MSYYLPNAIDAASIYIPNPPPTLDAHAPASPPDAAAASEAEAERELLRRGGWCAMYNAGGCVDDGGAEAHRRGVARNFAALHRAAKTLGAVPEMLSSSDFADHGPDEKAVILYVAFLCSRLLESSKEERSAHIIQRAWSAHRAGAVGGYCAADNHLFFRGRGS